ncbi:2-dehydropantoate 2-reductase [Micromonospora sp. NPDC003776]
MAVLGPGGVGGLLAALLSRAGHRVICIAGEETASSLRRNGINVRSAQFGTFTAQVEADTALREPVDLCVVTVKNTALDAALQRIPAHHLDDALLLPLLNGVEHVDALRDRYGAQRVVPAVIRVESTRSAPGVIEHSSPFTEIDLAGPQDRLAELAALLTSAGADTRVLPDENTALWTKLAFLAPFALLTTRHQLPIGDIRTERGEELAALVDETTAVGRACGAQTDATQILARYDAFPAASRSSMQRDAEAGRPLELDAIGGALLRAAERHGIHAPHTAQLVRELERLSSHHGEHDEIPTLELAFPGPERDRGVAAILGGQKTALTGLLEIYEHAGEAVPTTGQRFSVLDSEGRPAVTIEVVDVRIVAMKEIDDDFARAEGRGYADVAQWRAAHEEFFRSKGVSEFLGRTPVIDDDTLVVAERFRVVEPDGPNSSGPRPSR